MGKTKIPFDVILCLTHDLEPSHLFDDLSLRLGLPIYQHYEHGGLYLAQINFRTGEDLRPKDLWCLMIKKSNFTYQMEITTEYLKIKTIEEIYLKEIKPWQK